MEIFAKRLKDLRIENNISQKQLGKEIGVSSTCIVRWEQGSRIPTLDAASKVAQFFGVSIDYLAGLEN